MFPRFWRALLPFVLLPCTLSRPSFGEESGAASSPESLSATAVVAQILASHPTVLASRHRVQAGQEAAASSRFPQGPRLLHELGGVPLESPWAWNEVDMHRVALSLALPSPGVLGMRGKQGGAEVEEAQAMADEAALDLATEARLAFADYQTTTAQEVIHLRHLALLEEVIAVARSRYQSGIGSQEEVLRTTSAKALMHKDLVQVQGERRLAVARLNLLLGRDPTSPLPSPAEAEEGVRVDPDLPPPPPLRAAAARVSAAEARSAEARRACLAPEVFLSVDYRWMPGDPSPHRYGGMVEVNLPWLDVTLTREARRRNQEARGVIQEKEATVRAVTRHRVEAEIRLQSSLKTLSLLEEEVLPASHRTADLAQAGYAAGTTSLSLLLDSLAMVLTSSLDQASARGEVSRARAEEWHALGWDPAFSLTSTAPLPQESP